MARVPFGDLEFVVRLSRIGWIASTGPKTYAATRKAIRLHRTSKARETTHYAYP